MSDGPTRASPNGHADERRQWVLAALDGYEGRLTRYALRLLGDLGLARDAVQHTFLKLCDDQVVGTLRVPSADNGIRSVPTTNRLAAWLYTVCRNRATDLLRSHARERQAETDHSPQVAGQEADPAHVVEESDFADLLRRLIRPLAASHREAVDQPAGGDRPVGRGVGLCRDCTNRRAARGARAGARASGAEGPPRAAAG